MGMNDHRPSRPGAYDIVLAIVAGASLGWFSWWFLDGYGGGSRLPLVVHQIVATGLTVALVRWRAARTPGGRRWWVHLLWVPAVLFLLLMGAVVYALRTWQ